MMLVQITSRYFTAGIEVSKGKVVNAAPILRYMVGWDYDRMENYVAFKGWQKETVTPYDTREYGKTTVSVPQPSGS